MKKSEIFQIILDAVCGCMEVDAYDVLSANRAEDLVTARCIIAASCQDYGMRVHHIQRLLGFRSHNSVRYLLDSYKERRQYDRHFRFYANTIAHELDKTMAKYGL